MYDVLDVSRYIINYCNDNKIFISNLKLQKLLYFVQAYFLIKKNEACFKEDIEAWTYGPVVPEAYHEFKGYGSNHIPSISSYYQLSIGKTPGKFLDFSEVPVKKDDIKEVDRDLIDVVLKEFSKQSSFNLVEKTHKQLPWKEAYNNPTNKVISLDAIKNYFLNE